MNRPVITQYLSVDDAVEIVRRQGLPTTLAGIVRELEADFCRWPAFDKCARVASHSPEGVIELMPVADGQHYTFKYVNGHPHNHHHGLPTVMAFGVLADVATGVPELVSELTLTTALRTAATSVMAAKRLARPESHVMALIGNGAQSEFQALAFHHLLGIDTLRLFDIDRLATAKLMANLAPLAARGLRVVACASAEEAVQGADIVTTLTADKARATVVHGGMVRPGLHINAVGGDSPGKTELAAEVLRAARVFVEFEPQTRVEGDIQQMPADFPVTELWRVLRGEAPGRLHADEVTVFDSVGFALEDFSALRYMRRAAQALGLHRTLSLIPELPDPRNLYGVLQGAPAPVGEPGWLLAECPQPVVA